MNIKQIHPGSNSKTKAKVNRFTRRPPSTGFSRKGRHPPDRVESRKNDRKRPKTETNNAKDASDAKGTQTQEP
jgi:hypothetical protein